MEPLGIPVPVEIKVVERTIPPTVEIVAADAEASEKGGLSNTSSVTGAVNTATFAVSRSGPTTGALRVRYALSGSAANGVDYRRLTDEVLIPTGAASANIVIRFASERFCFSGASGHRHRSACARPGWLCDEGGILCRHKSFGSGNSSFKGPG